MQFQLLVQLAFLRGHFGFIGILMCSGSVNKGAGEEDRRVGNDWVYSQTETRVKGSCIAVQFNLKDVAMRCSWHFLWSII